MRILWILILRHRNELEQYVQRESLFFRLAWQNRIQGGGMSLTIWLLVQISISSDLIRGQFGSVTLRFKI